MNSSIAVVNSNPEIYFPTIIIIFIIILSIFFIMLVFVSKYLKIKNIKNIDNNNIEVFNILKNLEIQLNNDQKSNDEIVELRRNYNNSINSTVVNDILYDLILPLFIVDMDNNLLFMNDAFIKLFNVDKKSISFLKTIDEIKSKKTNNNLKLIFETLSNNDILENNKEISFKILVINMNGETKYFLITKSFYHREKETDFFVIILQDLQSIENLVNNVKIEIGKLNLIEK
jgi:PAS domain-containing protein